MRTVDSTYKTGAKQKIRDVAVKIETNAAEAKTITADKIISATIQRSLARLQSETRRPTVLTRWLSIPTSCQKRRA